MGMFWFLVTLISSGLQRVASAALSHRVFTSAPLSERLFGLDWSVASFIDRS